MKTALDHVDLVAKNTHTFWFKKPRNFTYIAGQFIELTLPHKDTDERGYHRWFTLSSSPSEPLLSITTKFSSRGSSFKTMLLNLRPNDSVDISSPMGDFVIPKDASIPLVFIVAGIGSTPVRSIAKFLQDTGEQRNITLIYSAKSADDIVFEDIFKQFEKKYIPIIGQRLSARNILDISSEHNNYFYISGPEPTVERLQNELQQQGVKNNRIFTDFFQGYVEV